MELDLVVFVVREHGRVPELDWLVSWAREHGGMIELDLIVLWCESTGRDGVGFGCFVVRQHWGVGFG